MSQSRQEILLRPMMMRRAMQMLCDEMRSVQYIANELHLPLNTLQAAVERYKGDGSYLNLSLNSIPTGGRPRSTTLEQDRFLLLCILRDRHATLAELRDLFEHSYGVRLSLATIKSRLKEAGYRLMNPIRYLRLPMYQPRRRRHSRIQWPGEQGGSILLAGQFRMSLYSQERQRVWRSELERAIEMIKPAEDDAITVWGGISLHGRTQIRDIGSIQLTVARYIEVLMGAIVPLANSAGENIVLIHSTEPPNSEQAVKAFLEARQIKSLNCDEWSREMSPMKCIWYFIRNSVMARSPPPNNIDQLRIAVYEEWYKMPQAYIRAMIESIPTRH